MSRRIGIIGLGVIGGSLGLALKKTSRYEVLGVDKDRFVVERAEEIRAVDSAFLNEIKALADVDIVILAVPVNAIVRLAKFFLKFGPDVIISDVGSIKNDIVNEYEELGIKNFVGAHPIAGREHSGINYAKEDLFKDKYCIITKTKKTKEANIEAIRSLWEDVGAKVFITTPKRHDRLIACSSHLVHVLAYCMANTIKKKPKAYKKEFDKFIGPSFRGFMRVVQSKPQLWREIILANKENILSALWDYKKQINIFENLLQTDNNSSSLMNYLKEARSYISKVL